LVTEDCEIDIVLSKALSMLGQAESFEPVSDLLHSDFNAFAKV